MAITYHAGRRIQATSTDVAVIASRGTVDTSTVSGQTIITFTEDGTFTPTSPFDVEYLVVGGGGAGGSSYGGGGGAGGLRTNRSGATNGGGASLDSTYGVTAQDYNITVGAGGSAPTAHSQQGNNGSNSSIVPTSGTSIISNGGGGGSNHNSAGTAGGSSGGSGYGISGVASLTSPTVQGYASGQGGLGDNYGFSGGGGGGAGEVGQGAATQTAKTGLDGGDGLQNTISGAATTPYYAGGGAGSGGASNQDLTYRGDGGLGGGGNGGITGDMYGNDATGYGSGGGGTPNNASGYNRGAGSSGIVIIRFATSGNTYETSLGGKPTNVQLQSRFEETDTRKMYYYNSGSPIETLDSTNGTTDWDVTSGGSDITKVGNTIGITGSSAKSGYYDLGANVSTSEWLLRFKITSSGSQSSNPLYWVGLFDTNTIVSNSTSVDGISLMAYSGSTYKLSMKNGQSMDSGGSQTNTSPTVSADTTTRYVEIKRDGSNAILTFYDSGTYATSIGTCTVSITGSAFRYLCAVSYTQGSGRTYSLSDVKFYNGTTTTVLPIEWEELGT